MKNLIALIVIQVSLAQDFQNDYCSWIHSQHVIDRIQQEVIPLFNTFDIQFTQNSEQCILNNFGQIENHLKIFGHNVKTKTKKLERHQCSICKK